MNGLRRNDDAMKTDAGIKKKALQKMQGFFIKKLF
jgi:hypothetical protein